MVQSQLASSSGQHFIEVIPVKDGTEYAFRVSDLCNRTIGSQAEVQCHTCGVMMAIPHGSVRAYLEKHLTELGGKDALVMLRFHHKGPKPEVPPPGIRRFPPGSLTGLKPS